MQTVPRCFMCEEPVEYDPIFEAPCGHGEQHEACRSAIFHPLCLMKWRESWEHRQQVMADYIAQMQAEFCPHGHRRGCDHHVCDD